MSVKLNAGEAELKDTRAGQWSVREEKPMEELTLGELLFRALAGEMWGSPRMVSRHQIDA
jgi:hypothetical protein